MLPGGIYQDLRRSFEITYNSFYLTVLLIHVILLSIEVRGLPIIGNVLKLVKEVKEGTGLDRWIHKLHTQHGPIFRLRMLGKYVAS